jgi:L-fuconolactonase
MTQPMIIDAHTHIVSKDLARYPVASNERTPKTQWYLEHGCPIEQLREITSDAGVNRFVVAQAISSYRWDVSYIVDAVRAHPDWAVGVGAIDPTDPDPRAAFDRLHAEGLQGVRIFDLDGERVLAMPQTGELLRAAGDHGAATLVMTNDAGLEDLEALLARMPSVRVVLDHCARPDLAAGAPWPGLDRLRRLARHENLFLKVTTLTLDLAPATAGAALLDELVRSFGASRLMWGSDFPHTNDRPYRALVELAITASAALSHSDQERYLSGTALELWPALIA